MSRCIHFKNGKFAEWGSISEAYTSEWLNRKDFMYLLLDAPPYKSRLKLWKLKIRMLRARIRGCSIIPKEIRHTKEEL